MNVFTVYGATEIVMVGSTPTTGKVWLSYYTKEVLPRWKKTNAESEAGRLLQHVRR